MKRLYALRYTNGALHSENGLILYFQNKQDAKKRRNKLIEVGENVRITLGPDHWRYQG